MTEASQLGMHGAKRPGSDGNTTARCLADSRCAQKPGSSCCMVHAHLVAP